MTRVWAEVSAILVALTVGTPTLGGQCPAEQDHRSNKNAGILIEHMVLNGTRAISSTQMATVTSGFTGSCFDENGGEISDRIRLTFQDLGYFETKVDNLSLKASDTLAIPRPVDVEADVAEGPRFTLSEIQFHGYRAFPADQLREQFPVKIGTVFNTARVRSGLDALRHLYRSKGYLDFYSIPDTELNPGNQTVSLRISINEGEEYRMGKLDISGPKEQAAALQGRWALPEGAPFDPDYLRKFINDNRDLLPPDFQERGSVQVLRNCRDATVAVSVFLKPEHSNPNQPVKEVDCEEDATTPNTYIR